MRERTWIVLLEAYGMASGAISREVGCTLNQIRIWFPILSSSSLRRGSFRTITELIAHITIHNEQWTKSAVRQKKLKPTFMI